MQELQGFASIDLDPGESREVVLRLGAEQLGFYNLAHDFVVEPGEFAIRVGDNAEDIRLEETVELPEAALPLVE
jgi:beta-glucosidase